MRTPPLLADFIHPRNCKTNLRKFLDTTISSSNRRIFPVTTKCGRRGSVSSTPTFFAAVPASLFPRHTAPAQFRHTPAPRHPVPPHGYGGRAIGFSIPVIPTAHIFHTALAVPAANHRNERIPTFPAGQQPRVTVLGLIAVCGASLLFEQALYLLPIPVFPMITGKNPSSTIPVGFVYMLGFSVVVFSAVVVQHAGVRLLHQNVFHTGVCP